ncbi:MAG: hypothetical protein DMG65_05400 [Candidatus Angelobacter sp. Gp1-AA117]|nr:MAG: hypothetical protein DMG65_05400 [Candidatus Angelobacter sp. Gp1-AA117]
MKFLAALLLIMASWLPATSQRSSYDPAAKQPSKQGDGFVDFALKQVNSQNKDYGCQIDDARKLLVDQTVKSITSWAVLVSLSFLVLSFFLLLHQHRERNHREIIAAGLLTQYHNALTEARSQAEEAIRRYNALVNRINSTTEARQRAASPSPEHAQVDPTGMSLPRQIKPQSAPVSQAKEGNRSKGNNTVSPESKPQKREAEPDLIAQISTLQQQLNASHEREKNLQKELTKAQRRAPTIQPKETNIAG